ncbi:hypothetical protein [Leptospira santarosai]|uniref:Uncharacterized protein n=1 Tax=Leptospira santarosai TaxID=28183 RepID=A0AB73LN63_9LEPT|nr:hypothetical protein [Leptospira santarosai]AVV48925.1 Uncharacterized protein XB17_00307 [Leptospira santarosai]MDI7174052.1 hypothetical protein [Leptospira santarosai]MDI7193439.1 hypothetical protein [Leptospira santarosai]MDO6395805.1 hypothetical protein [Leptospira santarosai]MDO6398103.1 hypothetical protein [Leptospira santarosai]
METITKKEKAVVQIYKTRFVLTKADRGFQNRPKFEWPNFIQSSTGFVADRRLSFANYNIENSNFIESDYVILLDYHPIAKYLENTFMGDQDQIVSKYSNGKKVKFDIFQFEKVSESSIKIIYDGTNFGVPKRFPFDLSILKVGIPLRLKMNWKSDYSFSSGMERKFYEYDYIIEFMGFLNLFSNFQNKDQSFNKPIELNHCKEIDLRKILI